MVKYLECLSVLEYLKYIVNVHMCTTVVWKIFVWNYCVLENDRENNFHGLPIPRKYFNNEID